MRKLFNLIAVLICLLLFSCSSGSKHAYEYKSLSEFENDTSIISNGTPVEIFAMSGSGRKADDDAVFYHQILVTLENGDTLRILSPLFKLPAEDEIQHRTYFPPNEYNYDKKILNARYERKSDTLNMHLMALDGFSLSLPEGTDFTDFLKNVPLRKELVAVNKTLPIFEQEFKTVVGILAFDIDPR